ncbi:hypothetical protein E4T56_gene15364 [Termitomyces sp. T112]|nr:hypothetical protein E4T56_gene15364 [Termitomyces sp. T112]
MACVVVDARGKLLYGSCPFFVEVGSDTRVSALKKEIHSEIPRLLAAHDQTSMTLWKPTKDIGAVVAVDELEEIIDGLSIDANSIDVERLIDLALVSKYWNTAPDMELLQVIVQIPQVNLPKKHQREEDDTTALVKRLKTVTDDAPSSLARPSNFQNVVGEGKLITVNRPYETSNIPIALYERAFGIFRDRCKQPPSDKAMNCLIQLTQVGCEWYPVEALRREAIAKVFSKCLGLQFHAEKIGDTEYVTDGHLAYSIIPAAIRECKNENGSALFQAALYYVSFFKCALPVFGNRNTCFPSILVVDSGSNFGFYAAIWDGQRVKVEPLCRGIDLIANWKELHSRCEVAATLDALLEAVHLIQAHYALLESTVGPVERSNLGAIPRYPYVTSYRNDNNQEVALHYTAQLETDKLLFAATSDQPGLRECIVKFTQHEYSADAHNLLVMHQMAPKLQKIIEIPGGWKVVIMDQSKYHILHRYPLSKELQAKVKNKVKRIVRTLHQNGFVHGDIRAANLLIDPTSLNSDDVQVHLIDFDWGGRAGEVRYPIGLNCETVIRPKEVQGGKLILETHDIEMISYLFV